MKFTKRAAALLALAAALAAPPCYAYFRGPASPLTLLARLHYNTLFVFTPCLGRAETFDDGNVSFSYLRPPAWLAGAEPFFEDPLSIQSQPLKDAAEAANLQLPLRSAARYRPAQGAPALPQKGPGDRELAEGKALVRAEGPEFAGQRTEYLYLKGNNGYSYRLSLPFYPERLADHSFLFAALYHSGLLTRLMPGSFTDMLPPRGFGNWFLTPCADKQAYCSGETLLRGLGARGQR